jgi:DNA polymerase I-like protein with 3'-5' exonuclease and polymerase domains
MYGMFPEKFAREYHVTIEDAEVMYEVFHDDLYPEVDVYLAGVHRLAQDRGFVVSRFGRRRRLPLATGSWGEKSQRWWEQKAAFREAGNFVIQSPGSDMNTIAYTGICRYLAKNRWQALGLGMTHDSSTYEMPESEVPAFVDLARRYMVENTHRLCPWLEVPLDIDIKVGPSWGTLKKWKPDSVRKAS